MRTVARPEIAAAWAGDRRYERDQAFGHSAVHEGPCIAVTSNDRVDYFGRTVNLAARVQGVSEGRGVMLSATTAERPELQQMIRDSAMQVERFSADLKGVRGTTELLRLHR